MSALMKVYILLGFIVIAAYGILLINDQALLIKSISNELNCKAVILLSNDSDEHSLILLEKLLNEPPELYTGIWNVKAFIRHLYSDEISTVKILVVMQFSSSNVKNLNLISRKASIASFDWLILTTLTANIESHFKDVIIPINCRFLVTTVEKKNLLTLSALYKISRSSELILKHFGFWSPEKGFSEVLTGDIFNTRMNFKGHTFKFAVHNMSYGINPCKAVQVDNGKQMIQCAYFDVWRDLGRVFNYTTKYVVIEDCYKNGSTGLSTPMLEMIRTGGADSGEDGYIWSSSRLIHNQFFWPLFHSKVILVTKVPSRKFSFSSYVRPLHASMWLALSGWLFISGTVVILTKFIAAGYHERKNLNTLHEILEHLFLPFRAICYQGSASVPKKAAVRIVYLMIYIIPVLLIPSYSGFIISSLSVPSENIPFADLGEFEKDGSYQLNAVNNTFFKFFLMTDDKFETLRQKKLISTKMSVSYKESFQDICAQKVTFIYEWPLITEHSINCSVFKFDLHLKKIFSSMAVRKNFPYLELFNRQMQKLINSGLNIKILEKNTLKLFRNGVNPFPQNYFQIKPFGLEDVLPLFLVLAVGMILSFVLLFFENAARKNHKFC